MRYIKRQTTNTRSLGIGRGVHVTTIDKEVILDSENVVLVPKGRTEDRPQFPKNGHMRYNTDVNEFEVYQDDAWRQLRYKEPNRDPGIVWQNLGNGNASETVFGPLNSQDPDFPYPTEPEQILVFVENVVQIPVTNYDVVQNPAGKAAGWYVEFGSPVDAGKPVVVVHNLDK
jgi:hypothetical protein